MIIRYVQLERYDWGTKRVVARIRLALAFYFTSGATAIGLHIPVIDVVLGYLLGYLILSYNSINPNSHIRMHILALRRPSHHL